jgi:hypothetical protein
MIDSAIIFLKERGIEAFERMGILVIPVRDVAGLDQTAKDMRRLLDECGYNKSWSLDPYYERHESLEGEMYK